ncbi:MAG: imidazolonepropionase [Chloroflexi bacterium]|nr:imidazolonepropionase [Chloroflexota bacterium]
MDVVKASVLIVNTGEVLTCVPAPGDPAGRIANGVVAIEGERIVAVGTLAGVAAQVDLSGAARVDAKGGAVAPGFVDCHTHLVFGGSRAAEYAARLTHSAEEVRALGIPAGIGATVAMTRAESDAQLAASAAARLRRMFRHGTTTVESKTGYGLTLADELKLLRVNAALQGSQPVDIVSTFLGAHAFPPDMPREQYVDLIVNEMIPAVAADRLAEFNDVFCDDGYFTAAQSRRILAAGQAAGLKPKMHLDQYAEIGGAAVALELGAVSADHLNFSTPDTLRRFARASVVGVATPMLDFAVKHPRPASPRAMLDAGMTLALATDLCPGCWCESMALAVQFACRTGGLSPAEALQAATAGAARALALDDHGMLAPGMLADMQIWNIPSLEEFVYRLGHQSVSAVVKRGTVYQFIAETS